MPNVTTARPSRMRRSVRPNVVVAHAFRLRSRELEMKSSCRGAETRPSLRFCAVRLAMPLRGYQIGLTHQTLKLFRIEFSCGVASQCRVRVEGSGGSPEPPWRLKVARFPALSSLPSRLYLLSRRCLGSIVTLQRVRSNGRPFHRPTDKTPSTPRPSEAATKQKRPAETGRLELINLNEPAFS